MQASASERASMAQDLARDSLRILLPVTIGLAWVWTLVVVLAFGQHTITGYAVLAVVMLGVWAAYSFVDRRIGLAIAIYLAALEAAVTLIVLAFRGAGALYLYLAVLPIGAALGSLAAGWLQTGVSALLVLSLGLLDPTLRPSAVLIPILLTLLTGFTLSIGWRRYHTALDWALQMTAEAQKNAAEARERRGEVRGMLKSLDEAYARLERTNEALIVAREAAEKAYRFKAEFVANVSHELRTPLNLITGFSEMVATAPESYHGVPLPSEYRGDVMAIYRSARHLGELINDVLDLSQLEAGRLPLNRELEDLGETIRQAADMVRGLAEAKGLRLEVDVPAGLPRLRLDRTRIRQVLLNLLTNATRFTDRGWIRVRATVEGLRVQVIVEDVGRGIAPDRIAQAFQAFSQLSDDEARQGSGLGLALSRRFVELHGGTMWIESEMGRGTRVGFSLPLPGSGLDTSLALLRTPDATAPAGRPRVLVLHDDPGIVDWLQRHLEGYELRWVGAEAEAEAALQEGMPAAALVGPARARRWTELSARYAGGSTVPTLTLPLPGLQRQGSLLGATDYLAKPVTREQLLAALARLPRPPESALIVDDDPNFVRLMTRILQADRPALRVFEASGGEEGLAIAGLQHPDLLLLDLLMPGVSGYDVLDALRQETALQDVQVIILSAQAIEQEKAPVLGEVHVDRPAGLSVTEVLQILDGALAAVTGPAAVARANAGEPR